MMKTTIEICRFAKRRWHKLIAGLVLIAGPVAYGDIHLDMLKTRTDSYTNVTVYGRSKTDIFIRHDRGIANIKLESLDPDTVTYLQTGVAPTAVAGTAEPVDEKEKAAEAAKAKASARSKMQEQMRQQMLASLATLKKFSAVKISPVVVGTVLGALFLIYLFFCYCYKLICEKTGNKAGFLIWLPVLQIFPLLRAASMSGWWFLGLFVPLVNFVVPILWCFKIVRARGKSVWVAIGLLFPITNLASLLFLAFSDGKSDDDGGKVAIVNAFPAEI